MDTHTKVNPPELDVPAATDHFRTLRAPELQPGFLRNALRQLRAGAWPTLKYLAQTDVHTFAFSVAANAILSFFPFVLLLMTLARRVFHSQVMYDTIKQLLLAYLPAGQDFIVRNLDNTVRSHHGIQVISLIMLVVSSTGIFEPLEVALNQVWGFRKNRSYIGNQLISFGLAVSCGVLAMLSIWGTSRNRLLIDMMLLGHSDNAILGFFIRSVNLGLAVISRFVMELFGTLACIAVYFLIYWLLPNGKVKARWVLPVAVLTGGLQEIAKYVFMAALPFLDFKDVYGPFAISVSLIFWSFISGLLLLGGARLSAAGRIPSSEDPERDIV